MYTLDLIYIDSIDHIENSELYSIIDYVSIHEHYYKVVIREEAIPIFVAQFDFSKKVWTCWDMRRLRFEYSNFELSIPTLHKEFEYVNKSLKEGDIYKENLNGINLDIDVNVLKLFMLNLIVDSKLPISIQTSALTFISRCSSTEELVKHAYDRILVAEGMSVTSLY